MEANLSLGQLRTELGAYSQFHLTSDEPLQPYSFSMDFDRVSIILSASPYIALKNGADYLCLSHIMRIKKKGGDDKKNAKYILTCGDLSFSDVPVPAKFVLSCR